jgi:hypothetical protein
MRARGSVRSGGGAEHVNRDTLTPATLEHELEHALEHDLALASRVSLQM